MPVDDAVAWNREGVGRDLPRKPEAECEIGVEVPKQRRDPVPRAGHDDVGLGRRGPDELAELRVALRVVPNAQQRDGLVALGAQHRGEALHGGRDLGDEDDSHPRSKSRMRSQSVTTLSNRACSVRA